MKKIVFGLAALLLVLALAVTGGARAQGPDGHVRPYLAAQQTSEWQGVYVVDDGQAMPADDATSMEFTTDGSNFTLENGDRMLMKGTYKLDNSTTPNQVDFSLVRVGLGGAVAAAASKGPGKGAGKGAGVQIKGIYEIKGDTMKLCIAPAGQPRPTSFTSKRGSGNKLLVMKRVKNKNPGKPARKNNRGTGNQ
jgi:uncharacterized protein (TIGR03067 family)